MSIQPNYNKLLDPITDVTTSVETLLEGAFGPLMGDQREEIKRVYTAAWGLHTLIMDIVGNLGIENIAMRSYLRQKFDSFLSPLIIVPQNLQNGLDGPLTEEQLVCVEYLEEVGKLLRAYVDKLWLYSNVYHHTVDYTQAPIDLKIVIDPLIPESHDPFVTIDFVVPDDLPAIQGDMTLVKLCLQEVIANAVYNTHKGYIRLSTEVGNHYVTLGFEDTGIGIDDKNIEAIFQPFYKVRSDTDGIGLGLSIVQGLMIIMRGRVRLYSQPEHGTSVFLDFPIE